jgi:pentatricopeptide repeat protein
MSLLRTLDRTSAVSNTANARPVFSHMCSVLQTDSPRRSSSKSALNIFPRPRHPSGHVENFFIHALVRAGTCRKHAKQLSTLRDAVPGASRQPKARGKSTWQKPDTHEYTPKMGSARGPLGGVRQFAKNELEALVNYYGIEIDSRPEDEVSDSGTLIWNVGDVHEPWPLRDPKDGARIRQMEKLLEDDETPHDDIYRIYSKLPPPGVVYLRLETIRALLHHLSVVERPSPLAMQRFMSILDDMQKAHIHITRSEWTSAIYLTGRAMGTVSTDNVQAALQVWRDMEHRAGVRGGYVTLNVLFDMSVKAGKYMLAETFLKEMKTRKLGLHRHFRVSVIYYYGVMQNGNAVRKTYQELVNAGDIVDTVVLNAVIAALIRAGEPTAAEHVFESMKRLHASKSVRAPGHKFFNRTWQDRRLVGLHLTHEARRYKRTELEEELKELQDYAPIAPDARTYGLLIRHQSATAGNVDRVYELLQEMRSNSIALEGTTFIAIFHGFTQFGGVRYSSWTRDKLEKMWKQYLKALPEGLERTWISVMAVIAALKAFAKCSDAERTLRAWDEIRKTWQPNEEELERVMAALRKLVPEQGSGFFDKSKVAL